MKEEEPRQASMELLSCATFLDITMAKRVFFFRCERSHIQWRSCSIGARGEQRECPLPRSVGMFLERRGNAGNHILAAYCT